MRAGAVNSSSTDLADVSWNVPTVSMTGATFVPGVPAHSWQATACAGSTIGVKGMMVAAKSMALTTVDLFTDPAHIQKAKAEFDEQARPRLRLQDTARRSQAGTGLPEVTALITGASSGIGLELARIFAANRHDVVLVARSEDKLRELARECEATGVRAHVVAADLAKTGRRAHHRRGGRALGVEIDVLVNNAGFGVYGRFAETPLGRPSSNRFRSTSSR